MTYIPSVQKTAMKCCNKLSFFFPQERSKLQLTASMFPPQVPASLLGIRGLAAVDTAGGGAQKSQTEPAGDDLTQ